MRKYKIEQRTPSTGFITFTEPNANGERLVVEFTKCTGEGKHFLGNLWAKHGFIEKPVGSYWFFDNSVYKDDDCYRAYEVFTNARYAYAMENGERKLVGCRPIVNFFYIEEATEQWFFNALEDIAERFYSCDNTRHYCVKYKEDGLDVEEYTWDMAFALEIFNRKDSAVIYEDGKKTEFKK